MFNCPWGIKDILQSSGGMFFPGNPEMVQYKMDEEVKIWFQQENLCGKGLGYFSHPTVLSYPEVYPWGGCGHGHPTWSWDRGCCHGALGMVVGHLNFGVRVRIEGFFSGNNFRGLPERLCIRNYKFCRGFVPSGSGVFMFDCQKQILSSCRHNPHNFLLCLCPPLSTGLLEAGSSRLHCRSLLSLLWHSRLSSLMLTT